MRSKSTRTAFPKLLGVLASASFYLVFSHLVIHHQLYGTRTIDHVGSFYDRYSALLAATITSNTSNTAPIYACITSVSDRSAQLVNSIRSVIDQVDTVFLTIDVNFPLPSELKYYEDQTSKLRIIRIKENQGSGGRFRCLEKLPLDAYVVSIDDDLLYAPDFVYHLKRYVDLWDRTAIVSVHGSFLGNPTDANFTYGATCKWTNDSTTLDSVWNKMQNMKRRPCSRIIQVFQSASDWPMAVDVLGTGVMMFHRSTLPDLDHSYFTRRHWQSMSDPWLAVYAKQRCLPLMTIPRRANLVTQQTIPRNASYSIFQQLQKNATRQNYLMRNTSGWFSTANKGDMDYIRSPQKYIDWCNNSTNPSMTN
jgi:hypothetical protein